MSVKTKKPRKFQGGPRSKRDVYAEVTDRVIEALENGTVPWRKSWVSQGGPVNVLTGRPYRGINIFLLMLTEFGDPRWGTFKAMMDTAVAQARSEGRVLVERTNNRGKKYWFEIKDGEEEFFRGGVRKGEKATRIILWKPIHRTSEDGEEDKFLLMRDYAVFNAEQANGIPPLPTVENGHLPDENAEAILAGYKGGPGIIFGPDPGYSVPKDIVYMPPLGAFDTPNDYYGSFFHELTHSTGHESRLNRIEPALYGTDPYAREELVAEMGAAMLSGLAGFTSAGGEQSAGYIAGWLKALKNDRKLVVGAAAQAQKSTDLIVGTTFETEDENGGD